MKYREYLVQTLPDLAKTSVDLPSSLHIVGHVALVNMRTEDPQILASVGQATLGFDKRIKSVAVRIGPTSGVDRKPSFRLVAGDPRTETIHVEDGVKFKLDPLEITFSRGNRRERHLVGRQVKPGEVVVDMFSCVGQFAFHAASVEDVQVVAIEVSQRTYDYLVEGITLNGFGDRVKPILGDCRTKHPDGIADRVYMGFLHETNRYLPHALESLKQAGGVIHMHMTHPEREVETVSKGIQAICLEHGRSSSISSRRIKWYSPGIMHRVYEIMVST